MERIKDVMKTPTHKTQDRKQKIDTFFRRIYKVTMILSLLTFVLVYSGMSYSFHEKQITKAADKPDRFFPSHSGIIDYPHGNLQHVIKLLQDEELIFVMYYAPWCAQSQSVRSEFVRAATVLADTVKFVAVNCWFYEGECRERMTFLSYPELFVYITGVQQGYRFSGVIEAEYMVKFAERFLYPLKSLQSEQEMEEYVAHQENTVIGYFDFSASPQPPGSKFQQFYLASLRVMSYDFHQPVGFGVVRSRTLARQLDMVGADSMLILHRLGNSTLKYPQDHNFTCSNITKWIYRNKVKNFSPWLMPPGIKSLTLSRPIQQGPVVLVFAPANPLLDLNPYLDMVRMISFQYRKCGDQTYLQDGLIRRMVISSLLDAYNARKFKARALENSKVSRKINIGVVQRKSMSKCCVTLSSRCCYKRHHCMCEYCIYRNDMHRNYRCSIAVNEIVVDDLHVHACTDFIHFYNINEHHSLCCQQKTVPMATNPFLLENAKRMRRVTDSYIANGESNYLKQYLRKFTLQKAKQLTAMEDLSKHLTTINNVNSVKFTGLLCRTNRTVDFYFIDSIYHSWFIEHLGIPTVVEPKQPSVILVDLKAESKFILQEKLTYENLANFVLNYSRNQLEQQQPHFSSDVFTSSQCSNNHIICLKEVTSDTFHSIVMDTSKDVVLLYYSHWCGYCSQVSHILLTVAQYFSDMKNITFARVNGDTNDLPWHYTVGSYPMLLFFPAGSCLKEEYEGLPPKAHAKCRRTTACVTLMAPLIEFAVKSESVAFQENVPKTVTNLIKFISYHANRTVQLNAAINQCSAECRAQNVQRVIRRVTELEAQLATLQRREITLWSQYPSNKQQERQMQTEKAFLRSATKRIKNKWTTAQTLKYFLEEKDWKKLNRHTLLNFLKTVV